VYRGIFIALELRTVRGVDFRYPFLEWNVGYVSPQPIAGDGAPPFGREA
jgi:hypothetical protein